MVKQGRDRQIDYVELNVGDLARSKKFYGGAFGWSFTNHGPDYCEFNDGRLKGGLTTTAPVRASGGPLVILYADDLEEAHKRMQKAGGKIIKPRFGLPGVVLTERFKETLSDVSAPRLRI